MTHTQSRVLQGVPAGGQFAHAVRPEPGCEPLPGGTASSALARAWAAGRSPGDIPWPEKPDNSRVEVWVEDDKTWQVLERHGYDGDVVEDFQRIYANLDLVFDKEADFWGVKADGTETLIAQGIRDYEAAVDPDDHEDLNYRDGFTNPMPTYLADRAQVENEKHEAARSILSDAGIHVEAEDRRGQFRLRAGTNNLRLEIQDYGRPRMIETRNWQIATKEQLEEFAGGPLGEEETEMLALSATLVARKL